MRAFIHLCLPENLEQFVREQVREKGYDTASEYVRDVLWKEHEHGVLSAVEGRLNTAMETPAFPATASEWQAIRREGLKQARLRRHP